ncbi:hypothetical protein F7984_11935 [Pradoshia sp. D12]|uniref:WapI family immunity protein n=1 Tax=Bacillaceae TaxID=186817 RepID=UPI0011270892|nr:MULTISPECIES: hypothetical protein [Bacillaceae]QFK71889.1 hypothetical protein F7984_11935 [Pradoshia sp. D12]TPF73683.1 hypothetical protein FHY44_08335 [Bacillus sp. D12]
MVIIEHELSGKRVETMNGFTVKGNQGFIRIESQNISGFPEDTSHFGGYNAVGIVEIKSGNYYVLGELWFTTGDIYKFYKQLDKYYRELKGMATFWNYETSLKLEVVFNQMGQVVLQGYFKEKAHMENELHFEMECDQTFLSSTLEDLRSFVDHYGNTNGIKK